MNASLTSGLLALVANRTGHFEMESGYHADQWFDLDRLFRPQHRAHLQPFAAELARRLAPHRIEMICGPVTGGALLAAMIATELGLAHVAAERFESPDATGLFPIRYVIPPADRAALHGRRIAIVDDAISAGSAVRGTYADALTCGAKTIALGALFVFGPAAARFAADHHLALEGLVPLSFNLWPPTDCPLCRRAVPIEKIAAT